MGIPVHLVPSLGRSIHPWRDLRAYRDLARLFRDQSFHLVHTHSSKPGVLGRLAARRAGVRWTVHHVHAFAFHEYSPRWKHLLYGELERRAAAHCSHLVFSNNEERELAIGRGWTTAERCATIYNGVDLRHFSPPDQSLIRADTRRKLQSHDDETLILFNGRLDYPKQPELLAEIAARLNRLRPCAPRAPDDYAAAIARLLDNPIHRNELGLVGRRRAIELFDAHVNNTRIARLHDELTGAPSKTGVRRAA